MNVITEPDFLKIYKRKYILVINSYSEHQNFVIAFDSDVVMKENKLWVIKKIIFKH